MLFHDWSLRSIEIRWMENVIYIRLRGPNESEAIIECREFLSVAVPREEEWGPSKSIHGIAQNVAGIGGFNVLKIDMQSGDTISVMARDIRFPKLTSV